MGFTNPYPASRLTVDSTASINQSLVGFWALTDGTGNTAKDIWTSADDATGTGVQWEQSAAGTRYDAAGGYVESSQFPVTNVNAFSISAWIKNDNTNADYLGLWSYFAGPAASSKAVFWRNNTLEGFVRNAANTSEAGLSSGVNLNTSANANPSGMAHCVFTVNSGTATWYINGVQTAQNTSFMAGPYIPASQTEGFVIGHAHSNEMTTGAIQNVRFWEREISATEALELYHRPWEGTNYGTLWPYSPPAPADATLSTDTAATSLMSGCVGWWPLTDGSGTTATDLVGSSNGTESGGVSWASSEIGTVASFDGVDDYFELGTASTLFAGPTITATLTCWVKPSTTSQIPIGNQYTSGERLYITTENSIWNIGFGSYGWGTGTGTGYSVATDEWTFLAIVINSGSPTLYVNAQQSITNPTDTSVSLGGPFTIGAFLNAGSIFSGVTDPSETQNVRIWDRVLTDDEITLLYERPFEGIEYGDAFHYDPPTPASLTPLTSDSINTDQELWLPLTDGSGTTAVDISSGGNDGTLNSDVAWGTSSVGTVAVFDDSLTSQITVPHDSSYNAATTGEISVSAWVKVDATRGDHSCIVGKDDNSSNREWLITIPTNLSVFRLHLWNSSGTLSYFDTSSFSLGEWHFVCMTWDGSTLQGYLNGVADGSTSINSARTTTVGLRLGESSNNKLDGLLQNVRFWSRALTADEVWSIYANPWLGSAYTATAAEVLYNYIFRSQRFRRLA